MHRTQKDCYRRWQLKKTEWKRLQTIQRAQFWWIDLRKTGCFLFYGVSTSGRVRRGLDNESWNFARIMGRSFSESFSVCTLRTHTYTQQQQQQRQQPLLYAVYLSSLYYSWWDRSMQITRSNAKMGCLLIPLWGHDIQCEAVFFTTDSNSDYPCFSFRPQMDLWNGAFFFLFFFPQPHFWSCSSLVTSPHEYSQEWCITSKNMMQGK